MNYLVERSTLSFNRIMVIVTYRIFERSVFNDILYDNCHYFIQVCTWSRFVHGEKYLYTVHVLCRVDLRSRGCSFGPHHCALSLSFIFYLVLFQPGNVST